MGFFEENDDPFDSIVREFFGGAPINRRTSRRRNFVEGEEDDRNIDYIEDDSYVYLVFELPGYNEKDVLVSVNGKELEIEANKRSIEEVRDYLHQKLRQGIKIKKKLPGVINPKKFTKTLRNGVLEIIFLKNGDKK